MHALGAGWNVCRFRCYCCFKFGAEADVKANLQKLRFKRMSLTERELHILAVAVTEMQAAGYWPFTDKFIVQVETWKKMNSFTMFRLVNLR